MSREISFIASLLDPSRQNKTALLAQLPSLTEMPLKKTLRRNKVVVKFERNLESMGAPQKEVFYNKFPAIKAFYDEFHAKIDADTREFDVIRDKFSSASIEFLLIKSDGSFPFESDNIDVLVKPETFRRVMTLLNNAGYSELPRVRESHKFLFRNKRAFNVLPLHIHTRVEWEGTPFIDMKQLWNRSEISHENKNFLVPSTEDCMLITAAHLFFEDHEIKLADLLKIDSKIKNRDLDWDYVLEHAQKLHWNDAFCLVMLQLNQLYDHLYHRSMLQKSILLRIKEPDQNSDIPFRKIMAPFRYGDMPLKFPYFVAGFYFLRKVVTDPDSNISKKFRHFGLISADVVKRNTIKKDPSLKKRFI